MNVFSPEFFGLIQTQVAIVVAVTQVFKRWFGLEGIVATFLSLVVSIIVCFIASIGAGLNWAGGCILTFMVFIEAAGLYRLLSSMKLQK